MAQQGGEEEDALLLLRKSLSAHEPKPEIVLYSASGDQVHDLAEATDLSFTSSSASDGDRIKIKKNTLTRFAKNAIDPSSRPSLTANDFYDVGVLLYTYITKDAPIGEYITKAAPAVGGFVSMMDRKLVVDFLEGTTSDVPNRILSIEAEGKTQDQKELSSTAERTSTAVESQRPAKKSRYVPNQADQESVKKLLALQEPNIRQLNDHVRVLHGSRNRDFKPFLDSLISGKLKGAKEELKRVSGGAVAASKSQDSGKKKKQTNPIIIVSPSSSAIITMYNVKKFLEDSIFEKSENARARLAGRQAEDVILIDHKRQLGQNEDDDSSDRNVRYYVVDSVEALQKFGDDAWDRVVCVITTGQEWQFRGYKWNDPKELFRNVKGIHFQWTNDPPNPKIVNWNVANLKIDPTKRHIDKSSAANFWQSVEQWIIQRKPWMKV